MSRPLFFALALLPALAPVRAANLDGSTAAVGDAEAQRLYTEANDYVTNVPEGDYSYAYMQFYWKRAESFLERAQRVYPGSPTALALKAGQLKVGPYDLDYFKNRVLPRLEEKRTWTVDAVTCANFLYEFQKDRHDAAAQAAFESIIEVLARQLRWGEVMAFPAEGSQRTRLLAVVFREAVRARVDQHEEVNDLTTKTAAGQQVAAGFRPSTAEAYVLLGRPRREVFAYVARYPQADVKLAVLRAMVEREAVIRRHLALRLPLLDSIDTLHFTLLNLTVRDDVAAAVAQLWPDGAVPPAARDLLSVYQASLGTRPADGAPLAARLAYLEYLGAFDRFDELAAYAQAPGLPEAGRRACELKAIEMFAQGGRLEEAERRRAAYPGSADEAELALFRGRMDSTDDQLTVREKTFSTLPIKDPCVLAEAIMEWSLTPNRSIRGAGPWDSVVLKYAPGFTNLPLPKSNAVREAASAVNPY